MAAHAVRSADEPCQPGQSAGGYTYDRRVQGSGRPTAEGTRGPVAEAGGGSAPRADGEPPGGRPVDLIGWMEAEAGLEHTPHSMSRRTLRRRYADTARPVWTVPGRRGELVSRSDVFEVHRDAVRDRFHRVA